MAAADQLSGRLEHAALDAVEAALLSHRVGEEFDAVVISARNSNNHSNHNSNGNGRQDAVPHGTIQISDPAVSARCDGELQAGTTIKARLVEADIVKRAVRFELISPA
jgi:exoribonuclease R